MCTDAGPPNWQFAFAGLLLWQGVWVCLAIVSIAPQLFQWLIRPLHVARLMDLVVIVGMLVLGAITLTARTLRSGRPAPRFCPAIAADAPISPTDVHVMNENSSV